MNEASLPIDVINDDFSKALLARRPIVVTAPTGSGKSTRLPLWLCRHFQGPILVIEPRRVACRSLADYLSTSIGEKVGQTFGYKIRFSDCSDDDTKVLFVTPGVALRLLQNNDFPFAAVLVDEFHERGWESDLVVTVLQKRRALGELIPLVVTSATIDGGSLTNKLNGVYLEGQGRLYPVAVQYDESTSTPSLRNLELRVARAVKEQLHKTSGDILVFLPGKGEIDSCANFLIDLCSESGVEIYRLHGSLPTDHLAQALSGHGGARRVFLSTNVSETSLTVPKVTAVVDSGLVRMRRHRGGRSGLVLEPIAKSSMEQRKGRAGRVQPGVCCRLWSRAFRPEETTPPAVERIELDDFLLHAVACGLEEGEWATAPWPTKPPEFAIESAHQRLLALRAITKEGQITEFGRQLLKIPLSVHQARLLVEVPDHLRATMADLLALVQGRGRLLMKLRGLSDSECEKVKEARKDLLAGTYDEVSAELLCLRSGNIQKHQLHPSGILEARKIAADLRELLQCSIKDATKDKGKLPSQQELTRYILTRWPEGGFVLRKRALNLRKRLKAQGRAPTKGEPWANGRLELFVLPYSRWGADGRNLPEAGVILEHEWVSSRGNELKGLGRFLLPCTIQDLAWAQCGQTVLSQPCYRDGMVLGTVERTLAGVTLTKEEFELAGAQLRQAVATLIAENKIFPRVCTEILNSLYYLKMLGDWPGGYPNSSINIEHFPRELIPYLEEKLSELGVQHADDIELLDDKDLFISLTEVLGIEQTELDRLIKDFPRQWCYQGGIFDCLVKVGDKTVDLCPIDDKAKKLRDIPRLVLPPFRGFKVRLVRGSQIKTVRN